MFHRDLVRLVLFVIVSVPAAATAGVPGPQRAGCFPPDVICPLLCGVALSGPANGCHYFFRADGGKDRLTVSVTLRDAFDAPVPGCSLGVTVHSTPQTAALCSCDPMRATAISGAGGEAQLVFSRIGGRGELAVEVTTYCSGSVALASWPVPFTSPDLDGSCDAGASTNVYDLGIWAAGLPPAYAVESDYNCDGIVNIFDLGDFAGGLYSGGGCDP